MATVAMAGARGRVAAVLARPEVRVAAAAVVLSRLLVLIASLAGAHVVPENAESFPAIRELPYLTDPFAGWPGGGVLDVLLTPLVRWDAFWYLTIAQDGYTPVGIPGNQGERPAFFPLFPLVTWLAGGFLGPGATLVAASAVSLVAAFVACCLLHRLVTLELGAAYARPAVLLLAFFPSAYFFFAPYTESLFLALSLGAVYAARTERWAATGVLIALAGATRNTGLLLVVPAVLLHVRAHGWRVRPALAWLALAPAGALAYMLHLELVLGDPLAWSSAQAVFGRESYALPPETVARGATEAFAKLEDLEAQATNPTLVDLAALVWAAVAIAGLVRRVPVPRAYPAYAFVALLPALAAPADTEPLRSMLRFTSVLFPLFMWAAWICVRRGWTRPVVAVSAAALSVLTALFAGWYPMI